MHYSLIILLAAALAGNDASAAAEAPDGAEPAIAAEEVDRELVVRFSRAYGMARGAVSRREDAGNDVSLENPDDLDDGLRDEIYQIMDTNGLTKDEWQGMLARIQEDQALRDRVESLSTPFRYD